MESEENEGVHKGPFGNGNDFRFHFRGDTPGHFLRPAEIPVSNATETGMGCSRTQSFPPNFEKPSSRFTLKSQPSVAGNRQNCFLQFRRFPEMRH